MADITRKSDRTGPRPYRRAVIEEAMVAGAFQLPVAETLKPMAN